MKIKKGVNYKGDKIKSSFSLTCKKGARVGWSMLNFQTIQLKRKKKGGKVDYKGDNGASSILKLSDLKKKKK